MSKTISGSTDGFFDELYVGALSSLYATTPYNIRLPATVGTSGQVLATDGVSASYWSALDAALVTSLQPYIGAVVRTQQAKDAESISNYDFMTLAQIASVKAGDLVEDVTVPTQAAITAATLHKKTLKVFGISKITANLTSSGKLAISGEGTQLSQWVFHGTSKFYFSNVIVSEWGADRISIDGIAMKVMGTNTGPVCHIDCAEGIGGTYTSVSIQNVDVSTYQDGATFHTAIRLHNARNLELHNIRILGARVAPLTSVYGIYFSGVGSPVEHSMFNVRCFFVGTFVYVTGTVEGLLINNCICVVCHIAVNWATVDLRPLLSVTNSHFNTDQYGIVSSSLAQANIEGNLFYFVIPIDDTTTSYAGVYLSGNTAGIHDNMIKNNVFMCIYGGALPKNGIIINGAANNNHNTISGNILNSLDTGIWLQGGSGTCLVTDDNTIVPNGGGTKVIDQGVNNIVCIVKGGPVTGTKFYGDGVIDKWGSTVVTLNVNGDGTISFETNFRNAIWVSTLTNGDSNTAAGSAFAVTSSSTSGINFKVTPNPGAVSVRVQWMAKGN